MQEYPKPLASILAGKTDVVYGSRFSGGESKRVLFFRRKERSRPNDRIATTG